MNKSNSLLLLAVQLRFMQFYAHMAHNITFGPSFFQDHKFFGGLYEEYEEAYDALIERFIGLGGDPDIYKITKSSVDMLEEHKGDEKPSEFFNQLWVCEQDLRKKIDSAIEGQSQGTTNFLQGLADESEQRSYKIQQRSK